MQISESRTCKATPATAWKVISDLEHWPEWTASMRRVTRLDDGPLKVGSRARVEQPGMQPLVWTVTRIEPEQRFDWEARTSGIRIVATHRMDATDGGLVFTNDLHLTGWLAAVLGPFLRGRSQRFLAMETEGWKQRSESLEAETATHAD